MVSGWLFDAYPLEDKMVFWIKQRDGNTIRLEDSSWSHSIYIASDNKSDLKKYISEITNAYNNNISSLIKDYDFMPKYERITDNIKSEVLKISLLKSTKALTLARTVENVSGNRFGKLRLYNVDLLPEQYYFYEHDIFPLAFCEVSQSSESRDDDYYNKSNNNNNARYSKLKWLTQDNVWSLNYKLPNFRIVYLKVSLKKEEGKIGKYTDRIESITIEQNLQNLLQKQYNETFEIHSESESDIIDKFITHIAKIDPDFVFTDDGDSFTFPYLIHRAEINGIKLILGRESKLPLKIHTKEGTSYFSYGRIYFKPTAIKLFGRVHVDIGNSFIFNDAGLEGLYEISRICRMPLHTAARASIGKCLSSLQFYNATQKDILVPWKPTLAEHFKTFEELLIADRGGLVFEPEAGVVENAAEFDFVSLYPNIMLKNNISAETIHCCCSFCHDSTTRAVPELDYTICQKKVGIIPTVLKMILDKRTYYKQLKRSNTTIHPKLQAIYDARQTSLKWILVTSFGYLGFNNAKFGRIDAHIAVCAFDRQILMQATNVAQRNGFTVLHGIVDSLWIKKSSGKNKKNTNANQSDYHKLKESIERKTGYTISFEGIYRWIVFVNSNLNPTLPVANRYFGVFEDNSLKIRGIEARRHDTPTFLSKCQEEILQIMAKGNTIKEVKSLMPKIKSTYQKYVQLLKDKKIPIEELVVTKRLSKNATEYSLSRNTVERDAIIQLSNEGQDLKAGQDLRYIITDYYGRKQSKSRSIPIQLVNEGNVTYDVGRYVELLANTCNSVTGPFGYIFSS
ncbi:MAG TPA: DNA polymerase domain-containing protein [Nitrososphaeraceae archaeon]|nr:DNA polymerase domain-containing protein [Nitrososphaeraceae archaeon]